MPRALSSEATQEAAAFALVNAVRQVRDLYLAPVSQVVLNYQGEVDALGCGWSAFEAGVALLEVVATGRLGTHGRVLGVQANFERMQPIVSVAIERSLPVLRLGFASRDFYALDLEEEYRLAFRPVFSSADPWYQQRGQSLENLARAWNIPVNQGVYELGTWHGLENTWDREAPRRVLALAWLLHAFRPGV
ncbi:MAG: hypothetical protein VKN33_09335 [Candidatus Sericytochromatia bacterium]|nr:hypothetical protein [Candidatus Sericytochromatia bacterium]